MQNGEKLPKRKITADLELSDGTRLKARLFVSPQGRVLDMLNDGRAFLPLETESGEVVFLHKEAIRRVAPVPEASQERTAGRSEAASDVARHGASVIDPYELLGVSRECSPEEIREAYRQRCRENHPDRLQALGLPRDYVALATRRMAEINAAYDRLRQARQFR
jgi:DnaJ-domain-containing protein 1